MYKKYLVLEGLQKGSRCQLPANVKDRYIEVRLLQNKEPIILDDCEVEVIPTQQMVQILKDKKGSILIQVLDSLNTDSVFELNIYHQEFLLATLTFDVWFEKNISQNQKKINLKSQSLFPKTEVHMIAHRGLSCLAPENTLPAYELAGKYGYFGGECDIHETADGEFILMHDEMINRMTNGSGSVSHFTLKELKEFLITDSCYPHLKIPTLTEYLQVCKSQSLVPIIEIKRIESKRIKMLLSQIEKWGLSSSCIIITFHQAVALEVRKQNKEINIQWLADLTKQNINDCAQHHMNIDCPKKTVKKELVEYAHSLGVLVNTWTVDEEKEMVELIEKGVDFITTNRLMYHQQVRSTGMYECYRIKNKLDYLKYVNPYLIESQGDLIKDGTFRWDEESRIFEMKGAKQAPATLEIDLPQLYKGDVITVSCEYVNVSGSRLSISYGTTKKEFEQVMPLTVVDNWGSIEVQFIMLKDYQSIRDEIHFVLIESSDKSAHFMIRNINVRVDYM